MGHWSGGEGSLTKTTSLQDPTDFEWSFWMEWGRQRLIWLLLGHAAVSQLASRFTPKVGRDPHSLIGAQ